MIFKNLKLIPLALIVFCFSSSPALSKTNNSFEKKKYQAIILGKITDSKIKKEGNFYVTEYNLIPHKWFFKSPKVKKSKLITIKILGAELPEKGIIIKASTSPLHVPIDQEAVFLLEGTRENEILTISRNGIISKEEFIKLKKDI